MPAFVVHALLLFLFAGSKVGHSQEVAGGAIAPKYNNTQSDNNAGGSCIIHRPFNPERHKSVYTVGVLAIRGFEAAYEEFNKTFSDYLTATAGQHFDPPIRFVMKPLNFLSLFSDTTDGSVDFTYVNPSAYSCIESEYGASPLVSQISQRTVQNTTYHLKQFGGVILARADNDQINTIQDLKDKIVAAASISGLGSGQMQFREMLNADMAPMNDPKQLVFTSNQGKIVHGVLSGEFDVGFVRTDQLERTLEKDWINLVDASLLKVIDAKPNLTSDGVPFPFASSTALYPEWNVAALTNVADDVARTVQESMLALAEHAAVESAVQNYCQQYDNMNRTEAGCVNDDDDDDDAIARWNLATSQISVARRCDTTRQVARIALDAMNQGKYSGWSITLSYMKLRSMQEATGFIHFEDDSKTWRCSRSAELYDSIVCPANYYKKTKEQVQQGCELAGLVCAAGNQCVCQPCVEITECIDSVDMLGTCVEYSLLLPLIIVPICVLSFTACVCVACHKSAQMVKQAQVAAENERELNEFIAHEVRNPLSAAISAITFIDSTVQGDVPITKEGRITLKEDLGVVEYSLRFISDLLRSMLDANRAANNQMILEDDCIGLLHDIFEPVLSLIYNRDASFQVLLVCPEDLCVRADRLRLHQVVLNLARNSAKFVEEGFIRLRADVVDNCVYIFVEDSGPGVPEEKRQHLFSRYQQSLDTLAQGTGVGLNLCKKVVDLMGGEIFLDESYVSGFKNNTGTRIAVNLNRPAEYIEPTTLHEEEEDKKDLLVDMEGTALVPSENHTVELPEMLSVLFVDDDRILRKQGARAIGKVCPTWKVREAANGETAMMLVEEESFDIVFMDQYMTSVEQSLTGTETSRAMRSKGIESTVCGLSANDLEHAFLSSGADAFRLKPFPCKPDELRHLLSHLLSISSGKKRVLTEKGSATTGASSVDDLV